MAEPTDKAKGKERAEEEPVREEAATEDQVDENGSEEGDVDWHEPEEQKRKTGGGITAPKKPVGTAPSNGDWQALWSEQYNAYYFYNPKTKQTTWENPVTNPAAAQATAVSTAKNNRPFDKEAVLGGIDPALAYLDPSLAAAVQGPSGMPQLAAGSVAARFNTRTGKFEKDPNRNPDMVSEYSRMHKQVSFYCDVDAWQKKRDEEQAAAALNPEAPKRKPTKKELEGYKAKAAEKKKRKLAEWMDDDSPIHWRKKR